MTEVVGTEIEPEELVMEPVHAFVGWVVLTDQWKVMPPLVKAQP